MGGWFGCCVLGGVEFAAGLGGWVGCYVLGGSVWCVELDILL